MKPNRPKRPKRSKRAQERIYQYTTADCNEEGLIYIGKRRAMGASLTTLKRELVIKPHDFNILNDGSDWIVNQSRHTESCLPQEQDATFVPAEFLLPVTEEFNRTISEAMIRSFDALHKLEDDLGFVLPGAANGQLFEIKLLLELQKDDDFWRAGSPTSEPDIVNTEDFSLSFEIKTTRATHKWLRHPTTGKQKTYHPRHLLICPGNRAFFGVVPEHAWILSGHCIPKLRLVIGWPAKNNLTNLWDYQNGP